MITAEANPDLSQSSNAERLLNPLFGAKLTEIRGLNLPFHEKAKIYAGFLQTAQCVAVVRFDCDVCVDAYLPEGRKFIDIISEVVGGRDYDKLPKEKKEMGFFAEIEKRLPEECKVRVQAATPEGYHTYCFDCDSTMCKNKVRYPDNPDWDSLHDTEAQEFLRKHPELRVDKYKLWGSTRRYISIVVLMEDHNEGGDYEEFDLPEGKKVRIAYFSAEMINNMGSKEAQYLLSLYRKLYT